MRMSSSRPAYAPVADGVQIGETSMADGAHLRGVMPYAVDLKFL
jgi:hypothetical protein